MSEVPSILDLIKEPETLNPDLVPWIEPGGVMGPFLKHPLCYTMLGGCIEGDTYVMGAMANALYEQKQEALARATAERRWSSAVFLYERPYRLQSFGEIAQHLTDEEYWSLLGSIWIDSENIWQVEPDWIVYLSEDRPGVEHMMESEDQQALSRLPSTLNVHRGFSVPGREEGLSWSLSIDTARWFATRLCPPDQTGYLATGVCEREDIHAHLTTRGELEIVVLPEHVRELEVTDL